jgi:TPR repeat protein
VVLLLVLNCSASNADMNDAQKAYNAGSYNSAMFYALREAKQGSAEAEYMLGNMYNFGLGVKRDPQQAVHWYSKAITKGHKDAQLNLGVMFDKGDGVELDRRRALELYEDLANDGDPTAQLYVGLIYEEGKLSSPNYKSALSWYRKAAEKDVPYAAFRIGMLYKLGLGVEIDYNQAVYWLKRASDLDVPQAKRELGKLYMLGEGVDKDTSQGLALLYKAAYQEDANAIFSIGLWYGDKSINERPGSNELCYFFYTLAYKMTHDKGVRAQLKKLEKQLTTSELDRAKKLVWNWNGDVLPLLDGVISQEDMDEWGLQAGKSN